MARATRIVLDLTLVSLRTVQPAISKMWSAAKAAIISTPAKPLVSNPVIRTVETTLNRVTDTLVLKITELRNQQLPGEMKYLENELEKVKRKMGGGGDGSSSKALKPTLATVWQYAKTEVAPPMTLGFFHGPMGQKLEDATSKAADTFIGGLQGRIREMDAEEDRKIKEKQAEIKAAQDKAKAEVERKRKEAEKNAQMAKKAEIKAEKSKEQPEGKKKEEPKEKIKNPHKKENKKDPKKK